MSPFFVLGRALVDAAELEERLAAGAVDRFIRAARADPSATLALGGRSLRASDLARPEGAPAFTPVGIGRPLSLEILTAYVGDAPARFRLGGRPDLLIASAVKSLATFDAAPRAIHQIVPRVEDHRVLTPSALRQGSPIVYYTRSVVDATVLCAFEFATDTLE